MATVATNVAQNPGVLDTLYDAGTSGVQWLKNNTSSLASSAGQTLDKVCSSVSSFFASMGQTLGKYLTTAKDSLIAAGSQFSALPIEAKVVGGLAVVSALAIGLLFGRSCKAEAQTPESVATQIAPTDAASSAAPTTA